jgi:hypothetical protein
MFASALSSHDVVPCSYRVFVATRLKTKLTIVMISAPTSAGRNPLNTEPNAHALRDPTCEEQHERVDDKGEQAQSNDFER